MFNKTINTPTSFFIHTNKVYSFILRLYTYLWPGFYSHNTHDSNFAAHNNPCEQQERKSD